MKVKHLILIMVSFSGLVFAQSSTPETVTKVATAAGNWLKLENDARALGMGGAFVAAGRGVGAIPYNPAGAGFIQGSELYYSKTNYLAGVTYNVLAYGSQLSNVDYIGVHLFYMDSGKMPVTTAWYPDGTGEEFNVMALSLRATYARVMTDRLKIGITLKYIRERIYTTSMQTFAVDIGSNFNTGIYGMILGMSVTNFGPEVQFHGEGLQQPVDPIDNPDQTLLKPTEKFPLPLAFRLGIKNDIIGHESVFYPSENHRLTFALDGTNPLDYTVTGNTGLEYAWRELVFLRMGTHLAHDTAGLSLGAGAQLKSRGFNVEVDYAYVNYGILNETHQFSLILGF